MITKISSPISVIMVSYYTGEVLFQSLGSVLSQTTEVELWLGDNGNPPDVLVKLQSIAATDSRLHLISGHGNVGFSQGCNMGARAAHGENLLFLNPDSLLPPDALTKLKQHGAKLKRPYMIGARLQDEDGQDQRGCRRALLTPTTAFIEALHLGALFPKTRLNFNNNAVPPDITPMPAISGAFMYVPREDFWSTPTIVQERKIKTGQPSLEPSSDRFDLQKNGFDENYFLHVEDMDLCLRFRRNGGEIYFAPDIVVKHIGGSSKVTKAFIERHKADGFIRYFHKNFGNTYPFVFLWLLGLATRIRMGLKIAMAAKR